MTIRDSSDLLAEGPAALLARPLEDFGELLYSGAKLAPDHLEAIDYALRHAVVRLLARAAGRDELAGVYGALRGLVPVEREGELSPWVARWRALADVLDARLGSLAAQDPERARKLLHADRVLAEVVANPGLTQAELGERLGLGVANLSRILGVLEAHEMIERRTVGREKRVHPGRLAPVTEVVERRPQSPGEAATARRGVQYLFQPDRSVA